MERSGSSILVEAATVSQTFHRHLIFSREVLRKTTVVRDRRCSFYLVCRYLLFAGPTAAIVIDTVAATVVVIVVVIIDFGDGGRMDRRGGRFREVERRGRRIAGVVGGCRECR